MAELTLSQELIQQIVDQTVEKFVSTALQDLQQDPAWLAKIETMINQTVVQRTLATLSTTDINSIVHNYVNDLFQKKTITNFTTAGMQDVATECQFTIMDGEVVVENQLTARTIEAIENLTVKNLTVKGSINTDNRSWQVLSEAISERTLNKVNSEWREQLISDVKQSITDDGINFDTVKLGEQLLVDGDQLTSSITKTNIQTVGVLTDLRVKGETRLSNSLTAITNRVGINTEEPESALTVWDEEVNLQIGKYKNQEAFIGTGRTQALNIGINKDPQVTLTTDGITAIKKLRVAQWRIGHSAELPNWAGTRGDIIFNNNPVPGSAFAWVCLGAHKWKVLKAVE